MEGNKFITSVNITTAGFGLDNKWFRYVDIDHSGELESITLTTTSCLPCYTSVSVERAKLVSEASIRAMDGSVTYHQYRCAEDRTMEVASTSERLLAFTPTTRDTSTNAIIHAVSSFQQMFDRLDIFGNVGS